MFKYLILLTFSFSFAHAYLVYDDDDYFIYKTPKMSYILTAADFKYLPKLIERTHQTMKLYENEFHWTLDERTSLIVTSEKNQVANAFATITPNTMAVFFKGGLDFLEASAASSWIDTLSSHEISHLYQLNVKNRFGSNLRSVFGNQPYILLPFPPLPLFISPSILLPTFILEGNAVLNESRMNTGGRLFSGESLVLTNELIQSGHAELQYIMNSNLFFPFGREKYILGGYFQSYLADRYTLPVVNRFFLNHAENNINPLDLRSSFAATFYENYEVLYADFLKNFRLAHKNYKPYRGQSLATSLQGIEFNRSDDSIYFLTYPDGKTPRRLNQFHSDSKQFTSRPTQLPTGKVYKVGGKLVTAASFSENNRDIFYTLIDENYNHDPIFKDKYITDIKGSTVAYFNMSESFDNGALYRNQEKITETESKALLDTEGNIYYFRQEGPLKVLYKNSEKLISIETYYAFLAEVVSPQEIYFLSNSSHGSSLFCVCAGKVERALPYDNIISAINVKDGFLISYQSLDHYEVAFVPKESTTVQSPHRVRSSYGSSYFQNPPLSLEAPPIGQPFSYFSLKEMRFSHYAFSLMATDTYSLLVNSLSFTDPLFFSEIDLNFSISDDLALNSFRFAYMPYATQFGFSAKNETDLHFNETQRITTNAFRFGLKNTVLSKQYHTLTVGLEVESEQNHFFRNDISSAYLSYQYTESYFLNYLPYTYFSITPSVEKSHGQISQSISLGATKMLFNNFYVSARYSKNSSEYFKLESDSKSDVFFKRGLHTPVYFASLYTSDLSQKELELLYEVPYSKYYYRFPFSLRRLAPFATYQKNHSKEVFLGTDIDDVNFATLGLEAELLLFHLNPIRARIFSTEISFSGVQEYRYGIEIKTDF